MKSQQEVTAGVITRVSARLLRQSKRRANPMLKKAYQLAAARLRSR